MPHSHDLKLHCLPECGGFQCTKVKVCAIPESICYHHQIGWPKLDILWLFLLPVCMLGNFS